MLSSIAGDGARVMVKQYLYCLFMPPSKWPDCLLGAKRSVEGELYVRGNFYFAL